MQQFLSYIQSRVQGVWSLDSSMQLALLSSVPANLYEALLHKFPLVMQPLNEHLPVKHEVTHRIITKGPPVYANTCRLPPEHLVITQNEFDHMFKHGIIRPFSSAWASPLDMVWQLPGFEQCHCSIPVSNTIYSRLFSHTVWCHSLF